MRRDQRQGVALVWVAGQEYAGRLTGRWAARGQECGAPRHLLTPHLRRNQPLDNPTAAAHREGPLALAGGAGAESDLAVPGLDVGPQHRAAARAVVHHALELGVDPGAPRDHAVDAHQRVEVEVPEGQGGL